MEWFALKLLKSRSVNQIRAVGKGVFGTGAMWQMRVTCSHQGERPWCEGMGRGSCAWRWIRETEMAHFIDDTVYFKGAQIKKPLDAALGTHHLGTESADPGDLAKADLNHKISPLNSADPSLPHLFESVSRT